MFLKSLTISDGNGRVIRHIPFHLGINLIVDETPSQSGVETGNSVGKTTVLRLINFCLGGSAAEIYTDTESKRNEYKLVKDYLLSDSVIIKLVLADSLLSEKPRLTTIERNFLSRKNRIQRINDESKTDSEFEECLTELLFPGHYPRKPSFRQIISHNIRYKDESVNNTLKTLDKFSRGDEYETLYLFLLGCDFADGDIKQTTRAKIEIEEKFRRRLEADQTRSGYEALLAQLEEDIAKIDQKRASLNLNPHFEADMERLNKVRYQINLVTAEISRLELRRELVAETQREMVSEESTVNLSDLRQLYEQATSLVPGIQRKFEELHEFHNQMVQAKVRFITEELPKLSGLLDEKRKHLHGLIATEATLAKDVTKTDSFEVLEKLVTEQNMLYRQKGEYENIIRELTTIEAKINTLEAELEAIDEELFSDVFAARLRTQLGKFNRHFAEISGELYGERYALKADPKTVRGKRLYEFTAFNTNIGSGKKQGEISCFDIAYTSFADEENIPCFHFLLNDKKELMHDNQLVRIAQVVKKRRIQFVASILQDKLPQELRDENNYVIKLGPNDKLFRIENQAHE